MRNTARIITFFKFSHQRIGMATAVREHVLCGESLASHIQKEWSISACQAAKVAVLARMLYAFQVSTDHSFTPARPTRNKTSAVEEPLVDESLLMKEVVDITSDEELQSDDEYNDVYIIAIQSVKLPEVINLVSDDESQFKEVHSVSISTTIEAILGMKTSDDVAVDKFNIVMTVAKLQCLLPETYLNDEVINFYMCMLQQRDDELHMGNPTILKSHFFNSFFFAKLVERQQYNYLRVKRWTKKFDVFKRDKIFIPVNKSNAHWVMVVVFIQKKEIHHYDSMNGTGQGILLCVLRWLLDECWVRKGQVLDRYAWKLFDEEPNVPQQHNGFDCGMFSIMCAKVLSNNLPINSYKQHHMPENRLKVGKSILQGHI